jgi:hypothetical protein
MAVLGKLVASKDFPSSPGEFRFWLSSLQTGVEVGNIVVAKSTDQTTYGLITDMRFYTDAENALSDFFSHDFGDPRAEPPTRRSQIYVARAEIIKQDPPFARPPSGGVVTLATAEEVRKAYGMDEIEDPLLFGLAPNGPGVLVPVTVSSKYVLGPEGAHVNISGASGLATKTSAAVFLVNSILSRWEKGESKVAVVTFNLKSEDLLFLERNEKNINSILKNISPTEQRKNNEVHKWGIPYSIPRERIRYFAPARRYDIKNPDSLRSEDVAPFFWTFNDVISKDRSIRLLHMLDPDDIDDRSYGVIALIESMASTGELTEEYDVSTFSDLVNFLANIPNMEYFEKRSGTWKGHHIATIQKVRKLINTTAEYQLRGLFSYDATSGQDIPLDELKAGNLWVIDIQSLNDKGKRIVFLNVVDRLARILEGEKTKTAADREFEAIVVFIDELNKFAPSGRGLSASSLKAQIVDIAARGRSIGLILIGAEQFASGIDREIYGNTGTHLVGRTEYAELTDSTYRWISGDLKYLVSNLPKGTLLLKHALFPRPLPIQFPRPMFTYTESEITKLSEPRTKIKSKVKENVGSFISREEEVLVTLVSLCRKKKTGSDIIYKSCRKIRSMGISKTAFKRWFGKWTSNQIFSTNKKEERVAAQAALDFIKQL